MINIGSLLKADVETPTIQPQVVFDIGNINVSSSMLSGILLTFLLILFAIVVSPYIKTNGKPTKIQLVMEIIYLYIFDLVAKISGDGKVARKIMPIIMAIMIFIGFSNILLIIPGLSSITFNGNTVFSTNTSDLNSTFGIAVVAVLWTHWLSIRQFNIFGHINKFIKVGTVFNEFKKGPAAGALSIIDFFVGLLDIVSEFAKSLSLSLRLFGNMFAGEILSSLLLQAFAIILPVALLGMSLFTGVLQAIVFGALVSSYFGAALKEE